jgi:hypothetical protein
MPTNTLTSIIFLAAISLCLIYIRYKKHQQISKRKQLIKLYGPASINYYAHAECKEQLKVMISNQGKQLTIAKETNWIPEDLLGKFSDIHSCDVCKREFLPADKGYASYCCMRPDEYKLWVEIQDEQKT